MENREAIVHSWGTLQSYSAPMEPSGADRARGVTPTHFLDTYMTCACFDLDGHSHKQNVMHNFVQLLIALQSL